MLSTRSTWTLIPPYSSHTVRLDILFNRSLLRGTHCISQFCSYRLPEAYRHYRGVLNTWRENKKLSANGHCADSWSKVSANAESADRRRWLIHTCASPANPLFGTADGEWAPAEDGTEEKLYRVAYAPSSRARFMPFCEPFREEHTQVSPML